MDKALHGRLEFSQAVDMCQSLRKLYRDLQWLRGYFGASIDNIAYGKEEVS